MTGHMDVNYVQQNSSVTITYEGMSNLFTPKEQENLVVWNATKFFIPNPF
jgi:hypothetical protein